MKEHYCSYEQAVKLKEFGFKDKCNAYYWTEDKAFECTNSIVHKNSDTCLTVVMAPFLWQVQAWLRDCKGIDIEINAHQHLDGESIKHQYNFGVLTINGETFANTWYNNYEQALSDAVDLALELLGKEEKE